MGRSSIRRDMAVKSRVSLRLFARDRLSRGFAGILQWTRQPLRQKDPLLSTNSRLMFVQVFSSLSQYGAVPNQASCPAQRSPARKLASKNNRLIFTQQSPLRNRQGLYNLGRCLRINMGSKSDLLFVIIQQLGSEICNLVHRKIQSFPTGPLSPQSMSKWLYCSLFFHFKSI